jgi:FK506-binding protein 4/5
MNTSKQKGSGGQVSLAWLSDERDKLRRTMSRKEQGDTLFRIGDYEQAAERYGQCLTIDNGSLLYNPNALEIEDSGGRLHAVLHCNRTACLMALKRYREAVKECTAALRIHTHYMKAMLR